MKYLIRAAGLKYYGYIVEGELRNDGGLTYRVGMGRANNLGDPRSFIQVVNPVFGVGDTIQGLATADDEYYQTTSDFIGEVLVVDGNKLTVRGPRVVGPDKAVIRVTVESKFFMVTKVNDVDAFVAAQDDMRELLNFEPQGVGIFDVEAIPPQGPEMPVNPWGDDAVKHKPAGWDGLAPKKDHKAKAPKKAKPVKPLKAGGFGKDDKVKLSPESMFNDGTPINPVDTKGVVQDVVKGKMPLRVKWNNGLINSYRPEDLVKG